MSCSSLAGKTLLLLLAVAVTLSLDLENSIPVHGALAASPNCQRRCGNISIPFPFGIGAACSWEPSFNVSCVVDGQGQEAAYLRSGDSLFKLLEIYVNKGEVRVESPISISCSNYTNSEPLFIPVPPFTVSNKNKLTAIGCAIVAGIDSQSQYGYTSACGSFCNQDSMSNITECAGIGCCQTSIPSPGNLGSLNVSFLMTADSMNISMPQKFSSPCSYAFVADANWFKFDLSYVNSTKFGELYGRNHGGVPLVLDWFVGNETCQETGKNNPSKFPCASANSVCINAGNGPGYLCNCTLGYEGNPYILEGCIDIDECSASYNHCKDRGGICINTEGDYHCTEGHQHQQAIGLTSWVATIPTLNGTNYKLWREKYELALVMSDNDMAISVPCPTEPVEPEKEATETDAAFATRQRAHADVRMKYDLQKRQWDQSNKKCLTLAKATISEPIRGSLPNLDTAIEYLERVKNQFYGTTKTQASLLIREFCNKKYTGGGIREHILKMSTMAAKLGSMNMALPEEFVVHVIFASLPKEFETFVVNYNFAPEDWNLEKLIGMCVQEEERIKASQSDSALFVRDNKRKFHNKSAKPQGKPMWNGSSSSKAQGKAPMIENKPQNSPQKKPHLNPDQCLFCEKQGHRQKDCPGFLKYLMKNGIPYEEDPSKRRKKN